MCSFQHTRVRITHLEEKKPSTYQSKNIELMWFDFLRLCLWRQQFSGIRHYVNCSSDIYVSEELLPSTQDSVFFFNTLNYRYAVNNEHDIWIKFSFVSWVYFAISWNSCAKYMLLIPQNIYPAGVTFNRQQNACIGNSVNNKQVNTSKQ